MRRCISTGLILLALLSTMGTSTLAPDQWSMLAAGIDFQLYHLIRPRPINLFITRMNRGEASATIDTAIAQGKLVEGREKVSDMAGRYNQTINYWGESWGKRSRVVAAINGYYFNLSSGRPLSGQIQSGWYAQRFSDYVGDAGFAWNLNRGAYIGKCVFHTARSQYLTILRTGETRKIDAINLPRGSDELILYTPQYAPSTRTDNSGVEVLVEMARPALVLPEPARALGTIVKIRDMHGDTHIPFDHVVLSASGTSRAGLLTRIQIGDEIGISQEISNCDGSPPVYWTKTYAATGGDYHFLTNGVLTIDPSNPDAFVPNSRTAVAFNSGYVFFIVVDGWNRGVSEGITIRELGEFARDTLGATDAVTLDSGGSSTMVVNGQVINNTYCNFTRECGMETDAGQNHKPGQRNRAGDLKDFQEIIAENTNENADLEALVGNALLMVSVEPEIHNRIFLPNMPVRINTTTELRLGPGNNFAAISSLPSGAIGKTLGMRYQDLNGILAKGIYWQRVEFGDQAGWIRQEAIYFVPPADAARTFLPLIRR